MIYSVINPKGGTGKTETVYQLSRLWPETGRRLLVVGLDPVATITRRLLPAGYDPEWTMVDVLLNHKRLDQVLAPSIFEGVDVAPEHQYLEHIEGELAAASLGTFRLLSALRSLDGAAAYDDVLIDAPGALGALVSSAIMASDRIVVASAPSENSVDGLRSLLEHYRKTFADPGIAMFRRDLPAALLVGQVVTQFRGSIVSHRDALAGLNALLPVLGTVGLHHGRDADDLISEAYGPIFWHLLEGVGGYPVEWPAARLVGGAS